MKTELSLLIIKMETSKIIIYILYLKINNLHNKKLFFMFRKESDAINTLTKPIEGKIFFLF